MFLCAAAALLVIMLRQSFVMTMQRYDYLLEITNRSRSSLLKSQENVKNNEL